MSVKALERSGAIVRPDVIEAGVRIAKRASRRAGAERSRLHRHREVDDRRILLRPPIGHALAAQRRVELVLMRLYHDVHAISLAHANYVKDTPDILRIYLARPRHQTRPHDTQPDEIHTHRRQKVEIILHKRQVGVERRCDGDPRSILHARTHALTHALTHARTYARTLYTTFTPRKNRWRPSASTNIRSRTTTGDTPAAWTATATANRHASLSWDDIVAAAATDTPLAG